ncbi:hypothetical protein [Actinacidiphila oryziradicis]|uniref:Uncharacterized protein n=1 Tax=Actinacidiphila oryziradicis TaxID=2571141 RepID=A0A4U0SPC2_9ACTN|nr:hypothetical protein [Actinacidiphila oryziradicis]TKA10137.1 hypothetical protein FCI23_18180 [Actinacidiphila oryziradicis]
MTSVLRNARHADEVLGLQRNAQRAVEAGYITAPSAQKWLDELARGSPAKPPRRFEASSSGLKSWKPPPGGALMGRHRWSVSRSP